MIQQTTGVIVREVAHLMRLEKGNLCFGPPEGEVVTVAFDERTVERAAQYHLAKDRFGPWETQAELVAAYMNDTALCGDEGVAYSSTKKSSTSN